MQLISGRIDRITGIPPEYRAEVLPAPRSVKIELTSACNYRCNFCVKSLRDDSAEMDRSLFSRIIREMKGAGVEEIGLFYIGESFLCPWLPDAILECKQVGFDYVFLTTNGSAASPERVEKCMAAGLDSLKFSLNFYSQGQMKDVAQVTPRFWRQAIDNLKLAREIRDDGGYNCGIYASSIAFDGAQGEAMRKVVEEIEPWVDEHYWLPLYGMNGASQAAGWTPKAGNPGRLANLREPLPCWAVFTEGHVLRTGELAACCFGAGIDGDMVMADLREVDFMTGWNSAKYQALRRAHLAKDVRGTPCESCAAGG